MIRPSLEAIAATLELRRWARRQLAATGHLPGPDTVADRVTRFYGKLKDADRAYAIEFGVPEQRRVT